MLKTEQRSDALVRFIHPRRGPDHLTGKRGQLGPVLRIDPGQERVRIDPPQIGTERIGRILPRLRPKRDKRSVDVKEQQRKPHKASHSSTG
ncbi:hypothetical protein GCM10014713_59380 [Streptomyces purpureus]|uniref:Uncharacterized protein n=1 Tax=Streptomyces purpureus TaxID=1951 RepID=A0A918LVZ9_9ACTN|nr:hypothetical protein GCM10014713_59380 [Streptomyces purpureus]